MYIKKKKKKGIKQLTCNCSLFAEWKETKIKDLRNGLITFLFIWYILNICTEYTSKKNATFRGEVVNFGDRSGRLLAAIVPGAKPDMAVIVYRLRLRNYRPVIALRTRPHLRRYEWTFTAEHAPSKNLASVPEMAASGDGTGTDSWGQRQCLERQESCFFFFFCFFEPTHDPSPITGLQDKPVLARWLPFVTADPLKNT